MARHGVRARLTIEGATKKGARLNFTEIVPWFLPGALLAVIVGVATQRPVARALAVSASSAIALVASLGLIVAATLTPLRLALESDVAGSGRCDLSRLGFPSLEEVTIHGAYDIGPNVLLFVPLGLAIGLAPRSRQKIVVMVAAVATPFLIEVTQLLVPALARGCESADVIDNLFGLALGLTIAAVVRRFRV